MSTQRGLAEPQEVATPEASALSRLTPIELNVARFVAEGYRNRQIGVMLRMTEQTVKNHVSKIFTKVGVSSRVELTRSILAAEGLMADPEGDKR